MTDFAFMKKSVNELWLSENRASDEPIKTNYKKVCPLASIIVPVFKKLMIECSKYWYVGGAYGLAV